MKDKKYYQSLDKRTKEYKIWKANQDLKPGLGDIVEKITTKTGIKKAVEKIFDDCGCKERKEKLNKIKFHSKNRVLRCFDEKQYNEYKDYTKRRTLDVFKPKDVEMLTRLYAWIFAIQYNKEDLCISCKGSWKILNKIQNKLDIVYKSQ